jgi:50S ribosomal subunit-associated GTPase HflX
MVVDGTRRATLDIAFRLHQDVVNEYGEIPFVLVMNKADLSSDWEIDASKLAELIQNGWTVIISSAMTGQGVEEAFLTLTKKILGI